jgi:hypothetical protein
MGRLRIIEGVAADRVVVLALRFGSSERFVLTSLKYPEFQTDSNSMPCPCCPWQAPSAAVSAFFLLHETREQLDIRTHTTLNFYSKKNILSLSVRFSTLYHNSPQSYLLHISTLYQLPYIISFFYFTFIATSYTSRFYIGRPFQLRCPCRLHVAAAGLWLHRVESVPR